MKRPPDAADEFSSIDLESTVIGECRLRARTDIESKEVRGIVRGVGCEAGGRSEASWLIDCRLAAFDNRVARLILHQEPGSLVRRGHTHFRLPRLADDLLRRVPLPRHP